MDNLLPCPFCGNPPSFREGHEHSYIGGYDITIYLECSYCPVEMSTYHGQNGQTIRTEDQAKQYLVKCWNTRNNK